MKVCLKNISEDNLSDSIDLIKDFCLFLQEELPLNQDIHLHFLPKRKEKMTTGVRHPNHEIFILTGKRLLIDILRTLAHEWVHEYQNQKMGVRDDEPIQDIGGPEENMASILSSIFIKKFQKANPNYQKKLYGE